MIVGVRQTIGVIFFIGGLIFTMTDSSIFPIPNLAGLATMLISILIFKED